MPNPQPDWFQIGPMPTDPDLEDKLSNVKHENNHAEADESVWIARSKANQEHYARREDEFFRELDKQVDSF